MILPIDPYIYALSDPREPNHFRYVGMALQQDRPFQHIKTITYRKTSNRHFVNWLRSLFTVGIAQPNVTILQKVPGASRQLLGFVERCYIKEVRELGHDLLNISIGGDGGPIWLGRKHTQETRAKMSRNRWTPAARAELSERMKKQSYAKGFKHSEESKNTISKSVSKYYQEHPEKLTKRSDKLRETYRQLSGEERADWIKHIKEGLSAEIRKNISDQLRQYWRERPQAAKERGEKTAVKLRDNPGFRETMRKSWTLERKKQQAERMQGNTLASATREYWRKHPEELIARNKKISEARRGGEKK